MAIENYFLSRDGRNMANKICDFISSLIIKIDTEANEFETKETYLNWIKYKRAYEETDDLYSYNYIETDILSAGIQLGVAYAKRLLEPEKAFNLCISGDIDANLLLKYLRKKFLNEYEELNEYYRQFMGLPKPGQEIFITNKDKQSDLDPDKLLITDVNIIDYPLTYEYVYMEGLILKIKEDNPDYVYLNFILNPVSVYKMRSSDQYTILYYNTGVLSDTELFNFFNAYEKTRAYIDKMVYVYGFNSRMPMYAYLIEVLLLQGTVGTYFNSHMDSYALANYTDQEIFDILDSNNLSSLKKVNINTLRKIIKDLPDLIELKGSEIVIDKILDIVADSSATIKRYYLTKIFKTDSLNRITFDTDKTYEENVDVLFKEKIIRKGLYTKTTTDGVHDYHTFVDGDDTWGGDTSKLSKEEKIEVKEKFRKEILTMDFSNILTKYLTISAAIDSYGKQIQIHNMMGLIWQFCQKSPNYNFLVNDTIDFMSYSVRPLDLYATLCWLTGYINGISDPDIININNMNISGIMSLRHISGVSTLINEIKSGQSVVVLPTGLGSKSIREILGDNFDYENYITYFSSDSTINDLMTEYEKNALIISKIHDKWVDSNTLEECMAWEFMMDQNTTNKYYQILFNGYDRFSNFIKDNNLEYGKYLELIIKNENYDIEKAYSLLIPVLDTFKRYIGNITQNKLELKTTSSDQNSSVSYLNDLNILFNEFLSIYTELHKLEYSQSLSDYPFNKIKLLYHQATALIEDTQHEKLNMISTELRSEKVDSYEGKLPYMYYEIDDVLIEGYRENILLKYLTCYEDLVNDYTDKIDLDIDYNKMTDTSSDLHEQNIKFEEKYIEDEISFYRFYKNIIANLTHTIEDELYNTEVDSISLSHTLFNDTVYE